MSKRSLQTVTATLASQAVTLLQGPSTRLRNISQLGNLHIEALVGKVKL